MNLLDENVREDQCELLRHWGIPVHQIGVDAGKKGMSDEEIVSLLHTLNDATFFTRDLGFANYKRCHTQYCIVCLAVGKDEVAAFARRLLRHPVFNTKSKRLGLVIRISHAGLAIWRRNSAKETYVRW